MIESLLVEIPHCYGPSAFSISGLRPVNMVFGANGSGKSSLAKAIAGEASGATASWSGGTAREVVLYNAEFVARNLSMVNGMPGVFTLGEEDKSIEDAISAMKQTIADIEAQISTHAGKYDTAYGSAPMQKNLSKAESEFREACWKTKKEFDPDFRDALTGVRGDSKKFAQRVLSEAVARPRPPEATGELKQRAKVLFGARPTAIAIPPRPLLTPLTTLPIDDALRGPIVGGAVVDAAVLIAAQRSHDWVHQGLAYIDGADGACPFCQQDLPESAVSRLRAVFNDAYKELVGRLQRQGAAFLQLLDAWEVEIQGFLRAGQEYLEPGAPAVLAGEVSSHLSLVRRNIRAKMSQPGSVLVVVDPPLDLRQRLSEAFDRIDAAVAAHNATVAQYSTARTVLIEDVWTAIVESELPKEIRRYRRQAKGLREAIASAKAEVEKSQKALGEAKGELARLEATKSSVHHTVDKMNRALVGLGFNSFVVSLSDDERRYLLLRQGGEIANRSLSEGERTLIAFLYFFYSLEGGFDDGGSGGPKVVVVDDPVSSLDAHVLFVVSTLIRELCERVWVGTGGISQLFILTHSVQFHKEVAFLQQRQLRRGETPRPRAYFVVQKGATCSSVVGHATNPISTTYDLLWDEVRSAKQGSPGLQNAMRRILENYFKLLGGIDAYGLIEKFDAPDRVAVQALFSWVNDGSHSAFDDPSFPVTNIGYQDNLRVFREVFAKAGHIAHYQMMMHDEPLP